MQIRTGRDLAAGGDAVGRAPDGRVVFIEGAVPDEVVEIEVLKENRTFIRARTSSVVEPGKSRVEPPCRYYGVCGGCTLQHVAAEEQTRSKQGSLLDALVRIGKVDLGRVTIADPWRAPSGYGYRTRARVAIDGRGHVGFRARRSNEIIDIEECVVLAPALGLALRKLRERLKNTGSGEHESWVPLAASPVTCGHEREIEVEAVASGDRTLIGLPPRIAHLEGVFDQVRLARVPADAIEVSDPYGPLLVAPGVFAQGNAEGNRAMVEHLDDLLAQKTIGAAVELYSGSGNFTRVLARRARHVRAYESAAAACDLARRILPPHVEVVNISAEEALFRLVAEKHAVELILLDPPRTGVSPRALELIGALRPSAILYVSCMPATFARDVQMLRAHAFELDHVRLFDLYPQTGHVELMGRLERDS